MLLQHAEDHGCRCCVTGHRCSSPRSTHCPALAMFRQPLPPEAQPKTSAYQLSRFLFFLAPPPFFLMDLAAASQGTMVMGAIAMRTDLNWLISSCQGPFLAPPPQSSQVRRPQREAGGPPGKQPSEGEQNLLSLPPSPSSPFPLPSHYQQPLYSNPIITVTATIIIIYWSCSTSI